MKLKKMVNKNKSEVAIITKMPKNNICLRIVLFINTGLNSRIVLP